MSTIMNMLNNLFIDKIYTINNLQELKIKYRLEIDLIDDEIIKLLEQRKKCCQNIGNIKKKLNEDVISTTREQEILDRLKSKSEILDYSEIESIYNNLFKVFTQVQSK